MDDFEPIRFLRLQFRRWMDYLGWGCRGRHGLRSCRYAHLHTNEPSARRMIERAYAPNSQRDDSRSEKG
jgi:hypothetical protein